MIGTTSTDFNGLYQFNNILPGDYYIQIDNASFPDATYTAAIPNVGANDAIDSDIIPTTMKSLNFSLVSGTDDITRDAGIHRYGDPSITDPCGCEERFIHTPPNQDPYLYAETVEVLGTPGGTWRVIASDPVQGVQTAGVYNDTPSIGFNPEDDDPIGDLLTETSAGVYAYSFFHYEPDGYTLVVSDGVDTLWISAACQSVQEQYDHRLDTMCAYQDAITLQTSFAEGTTEYYFMFDSAFHFQSGFDENIWIDEAVARGQIFTFDPNDYPNSDSVALHIKWIPNNVGQLGVCPKTLVINVPIDRSGRCLSQIGDYVWFDEDRDGIQDPTETGRAGVTVTLLDAIGNPVLQDGQGNPIPTVTTGADGSYEFINLIPGDYQVQFSKPGYGLEFTDANQGPSDLLDSDVDPNTGITALANVVENQRDSSLDVGIRPLISLKIRGNVFYDVNALTDNLVSGNPYIPSGLNAILVWKKPDGSEEVVDVSAVPDLNQVNAGQFELDGFSDTEYYVMLTTTTPSIGDIPPLNSSRPPTYFSTGEQIKDTTIGGTEFGSDGTVDGISRLFTTLSVGSDVIKVDFGIRRFTSLTVD